MVMKKAFYLLLSIILYTPLTFAQVKFTTTASKTNVAVGERFRVVYSINANADQFTLPYVPAMQVFFGPNATFNHIINKIGDTTFNVTYSYMIVAHKEGTFDIGSASAIVNGQKVLSNSLKIEVNGQFPAGQPQIEMPDVFAAANNSSPYDTVDIKILPKQIFIKVKTDKTHAYVGEPVKITYKLYTRVIMASGEMDKTPIPKDFHKEDIAEPKVKNMRWTTEKVNGNDYLVLIIKQLVVSPQRAGNLTIPPVSLSTILNNPEGIAFNSPSYHFQQIQVKYTLKSAPVIIHAIARRSNKL
jgi:hypothetical protein